MIRAEREQCYISGLRRHISFLPPRSFLLPCIKTCIALLVFIRIQASLAPNLLRWWLAVSFYSFFLFLPLPLQFSSFCVLIFSSSHLLIFSSLFPGCQVMKREVSSSKATKSRTRPWQWFKPASVKPPSRQPWWPFQPRMIRPLFRTSFLKM